MTHVHTYRCKTAKFGAAEVWNFDSRSVIWLPNLPCNWLLHNLVPNFTNNFATWCKKVTWNQLQTSVKSSWPFWTLSICVVVLRTEFCCLQQKQDTWLACSFGWCEKMFPYPLGYAKEGTKEFSGEWECFWSGTSTSLTCSAFPNFLNPIVLRPLDFALKTSWGRTMLSLYVSFQFAFFPPKLISTILARIGGHLSLTCTRVPTSFER